MTNELIERLQKRLEYSQTTGHDVRIQNVNLKARNEKLEAQLDEQQQQHKITCDHFIERIEKLEAENERLKEFEANYAVADVQAQQWRDDVDAYQQILDEIIVSLGSLGISRSAVVSEVKLLKARNEKLEAVLRRWIHAEQLNDEELHKLRCESIDALEDLPTEK